eukprot:Nitzschia sp. Nitz4//scaffold73_size107353//50958//52361//NITZ4_004319-RA/size107353-processed-gene-0.25-mRNA-1//-1//CDS//3329557473//5517//frame0
MMFRQALLLLALVSSQVDGHGQMSRHLVTDDLSMVVVMADATTTQGPYYETDEDYINTSDMTAYATAGSPGVTEDRSTVLDGIPLELSITVYDLSTSSSGYANECGGVEVFLWHTDAAGVYSDVDQSRQRTEGTTGQNWLRAYQTTGQNGKVTFNTILPGWYTGRAIHYHVRLRYTGSNSWAATSQFLVDDSTLNLYETVSPYSSNNQQQTSLSRDNIYTGLSSSVRELLVLQLEGSVETGYTAEMELGLGSTGSSALCSEYASTPAPVTATTSSPTAEPTSAPTSAPTVTGMLPTVLPSTDLPTSTLTVSPTMSPSALPTTAGPTSTPTVLPAMSPTVLLSAEPTSTPTASPTMSPTVLPTTGLVTDVPTTESPSKSPSTLSPTGIPTKSPVVLPADEEEVSPTMSPTVSSTETTTTTTPPTTAGDSVSIPAGATGAESDGGANYLSANSLSFLLVSLSLLVACLL